jgi:hypothetical protein
VTQRWIKYIESNSLPTKLDSKLLTDEFAFKKKNSTEITPELRNFVKRIPEQIELIRSEWNYSMFEFDYYVT